MRLENPHIAPALADWQFVDDRITLPNGAVMPCVVVFVHSANGTAVHTLEPELADEIADKLKAAASAARQRMLADPPKPRAPDGNGSADPVADLSRLHRQLRDGPPTMN